MEEKMEKLLNLISEIVDDTSIHWSAKRDMLERKAKEYDRWESSLEEFYSWFFPDEED